MQINNFGQTPRRLFKKPHPARNKTEPLPTVYSHCDLLRPSPTPIREIGGAVGELRLVSDTIYAVRVNETLILPHCNKYFSWGYPDHSLHERHGDTGRVIAINENLHDDQILCVRMAEGSKKLIFAGVADSTLAVWSAVKEKKARILTLEQRLCGHLGPVTCLAVSRSYSLVVSGSADGTCIVWNLNTLTYVRQLPDCNGPVVAVAVNHLSGDIVASTATAVYVWSVNGRLLASRVVARKGDNEVLCLATSLGRVWDESNVVVTGHTDGVIGFWSVVSVVEEMEGTRTFSRRLELRNQLRRTADDRTPVTALLISNDCRKLFSGDGAGRIFSWSLPDAGATDFWVKDADVTSCQGCNVTFTVIERRHQYDREYPVALVWGFVGWMGG